MLCLNRVSKTFYTKNGAIPVLDKLSLAIKTGEFVSLIGPSGCGKSTIIHILAGFLTPDCGTATFEDSSILSPSNDRVVIFQEDAVFPWMTVRENVEAGLRFVGVPRKQRRDISTEYLKTVGISDFGDFWPKQLSGGMRKRVELARAYAARTECLLMDEPFGALDVLTRRAMQMELLAFWAREPKPILFVTHDVEEALFLSDRILVMTDRPTKMLQEVIVPFSRPRDEEMRRDARFVELRYALENAIATPPLTT